MFYLHSAGGYFLFYFSHINFLIYYHNTMYIQTVSFPVWVTDKTKKKSRQNLPHMLIHVEYYCLLMNSAEILHDQIYDDAPQKSSILNTGLGQEVTEVWCDKSNNKNAYGI